jgi:hypothetical protein
MQRSIKHALHVQELPGMIAQSAGDAGLHGVQNERSWNRSHFLRNMYSFHKEQVSFAVYGSAERRQVTEHGAGDSRKGEGT